MKSTFYYVRHGHRLNPRRYTVVRRTDFGFRSPDTFEVVISRHIFYRRAAIRAGRLNQRRLQREQITRKG